MTDNQDFLRHFGIPGQKWGVRRFQNEDGTLTEEGKQRYLESYARDAVNAASYAGLFKLYSDPKMAATKEAAEHNRIQAIRANNIAKYNAKMSEVIEKNKNVDFSYVKKILPEMAKKYNIDLDELMNSEIARWDELIKESR